jgi:biotin carboxylase
MKRRTALVLGTNAGQADFIRCMKSAGWRVVACGHEATGPGIALADEFELVDIKDVDGVAGLARRYGAALVHSVASDLAVPTVVAVSERLGLPHFFDSDLVDTLVRKTRLRRRLAMRGLSPVEFKILRSLDDTRGWSSFPCIVKPSNSWGQRGVTLVHGEGEFGPALQTAMEYSRSGEAIVEEYLAGIEVSSNLLVSRGRVVVNEISERIVHPPPLTGIPQGHLLPVAHASDGETADAASLAENVIRELGVTDGLLYAQIKITPDGPRVVEIAPRLDGCHIWRLIKLARGYDLLDLMVRCLLGDAVSPPYALNLKSRGYELRFLQKPPGLPFDAGEFHIPEDALYREYRYANGDIIRPINGRLEVVGYYVRRLR